MQRNPLPPITVVRSETHVELELMRLPTMEVEFSSPDEEVRYERSDLELANRIESVVAELFPHEPQEELVCTSLDWWPDKSRSVMLSERAFRSSLVSALASLLAGEYADWKIHATVCKRLGAAADDAEIGTICLMRNRIILQNSLYELIRREG